MDEKQLKEALDAKFKGFTDSLKEMQENGATKSEIEAVHKEIEKSGQAIEDFIASQKTKTVLSVSKQFKQFVSDNTQAIKDIYKAQTGTIEFTPKAVADVTTGSGTNEETPSVLWHNDLGDFNYRNDDSLVQLATVSSTGSPTYSYTEMLPKEGGYAFVAEGNAKPQIDFKWENRFAEPKKSAAYEILTEEAATDIVRMEATARDFLLKRHNLHKANAIYFADGTGASPTGATAYARTFVAGDMALAVTKPNFMDVVNACITDIYTTQAFEDQAEYMANIVLVNPVDFYLELVSAKDENGLPLYPQAGLFNQVQIGGATIRPWAKIPAGKIFVGDMKVYNVINYVPFSVRIGWINDQFITNKFTMLGESRYFAFVKNLDQAALIYDDIATVKSAITAA
tara:strand:- start:7982 stop:9175 length:1194 start_codon:yes stop_codon:yes gene_type:complete